MTAEARRKPSPETKVAEIAKIELLPSASSVPPCFKGLMFCRLGPMDTCWRQDKKAKFATGLLLEKSFTTAVSLWQHRVTEMKGLAAGC